MRSDKSSELFDTGENWLTVRLQWTPGMASGVSHTQGSPLLAA